MSSESALKRQRVDEDGKDTYPVISRVADGAHVSGMEQYRAMYDKSINSNSEFWGEMAKKQLTWFRDFDSVSSGGFEDGDVAWFGGGQLNVAYNCIDRHIATRGDQVAIIHEGDEPGQATKITYKQLLAEVCRVANVMKDAGVKRGDCVTIY
eukprot:g3261.t1